MSHTTSDPQPTPTLTEGILTRYGLHRSAPFNRRSATGFFCGVAISLSVAFTGAALDAQNLDASLPKSTLAPYVEYANTSSHILLGITQNRRLAAAGVEYTRKLLQRGKFAWYYAFDLKPILFLQDPVSTTTQTVQFGNQPPFGPFLLQQGPIPRSCQSATFADPQNQQQAVTIILTRVCDTRWTYAGGVSPLGQQVAFFPSKRIQPFILGNAGIVAATRDVPADNSSSFNFTFEFGAGVRIMRRSTRGLSIDYSIRHLSNRALGDNNPGIDTQIVRLSYLFGKQSWKAQ